MRTGAIFARGSCRALKWMALVSVVFALGAASAAAQGTLTLSSNMENSTADVTLTLDTAPTADRTFTLTLGTDNNPDTTIDESVAPYVAENGDRVLVVSAITVEDGETTATAVRAIDFRPDPDAEDDYFSLAAAEGGDTITGYFMIDDDDPQAYNLTLPTTAAGAITEGDAAATLTLEADPARSADIPIALELTASDSTKYTLGQVMNSASTPAPTSVFGSEGDNNPVTATIQALADGDRANDMITVTAYSGTLGAREMLTSLNINVKDANALPMVGAMLVGADGMALEPQPDSVDEGDTVMVKLTVLDDDGEPAAAVEALSVSLTQVGSASSADFSLSMNPITIASGDMSSTVNLTAEGDQAVDPGETLMFNASVSGEAANGSGSEESSGILLLMINDETMKQVAVKDGAEDYIGDQEAAAAGNDGLNPGEDFSLMKSMLFESPDGYTFRASAESSAPAMVSVDDTGDSITVMPLTVTTSPVMITVTAVARMAGSTFATRQDTPNVAEITFMVGVDAAPTDAPDAPAAPTVATAKAQGSLDVSWTAPNDNGSAIIDYSLRYKVGSSPDWTVMTEAVTGMSTTLSKLAAGTTYDVQVRARNADGMSPWSISGSGATLPAPTNAVPDAPAAPTVATAKAQGSLDVSWTAPSDNGSAIIDYRLQYRVQGSANWTVMTEAVTGTTTTLSRMPASTTYEVQVRARNANGSSDWSKSGMGTTAAPPAVPVVRGQLTEFKLVGDGVSEKTIGGVERYHVPEGSQAVDLSVTVQWTHAEIAAIGYNTAQTIDVAIRSGGSTLPNWVSWIDGEGDVHFPRAGSLGNLTGGVVTVKTPRESQVPAAQRGSERHVKSVTGTLDVLILHDDHEAENDAFYIEATGGDVDLNAPRGVNAVTPEVVIEDDEDQTVTVKMGTKTSSTVYEGDSGDDVPTFTVAASPARVDLPLEVRLDMVDLGGTTVSSGEISLSRSSMTLNDGSTGNSDTVTVHLPASDGNRVDDDYELHASVNVYSLTSGGYETLPAASHPIKVLDRHKLPTLMVTPATGTVTEGGMVELTLTINRNPSNTPVSSTEKLQYTQEEVSIMLDMGAGSTASAADFSVMTNPVVFPKRERGSYTASKTVEVMATSDDVLDDMEMLVLDAMVAGSVAANGTEKDSHMAVSTLTIEDGTGKLVWANSQEEVEAAVYAAKNAGMGDDMTFTAGEMIEVMGGLLFSSAEGVTVSYSAMTSDAAVASTSVSGGMVKVTAMGAGMADITIKAHASRPSGVKIADQTDPSEASIMFPVEVGLEALSITLSGPDEMNLVEGGVGAMVMATANRAVTEDVTVTLMRDRSMSTAGDADYSAEPITIAAGQMAGSTMVMAVEDDMMETVDNMPEELVLYGMAEGMAGEVTGEVKLYLWDAAVPALPVIAQLLLAAFLAVGGYRRYRRR